MDIRDSKDHPNCDNRYDCSGDVGDLVAQRGRHVQTNGQEDHLRSTDKDSEHAGGFAEVFQRH